MPARFDGDLGSFEHPLALAAGERAAKDIAVNISFALSLGVRLFAIGHEGTGDCGSLRLALDAWPGPQDEVKVLLRAGMKRMSGRWVPNGRPDHLKTAVDQSLLAVGRSNLFLLFCPRDPRVPFEETLGALAELRQAGKVEHLGLRNATPGDLHEAQRHAPIAAVLNELSVLNRASAANALLMVTQEQGMAFFADRPLGGRGNLARLAVNPILMPLSQRHQVSPQQMALAAVLDAGPHVVPIIDAASIESIRNAIAATRLALDVSDRTALEFGGMSFAPEPEALAAARQLFPVAAPAPTIAVVAKKRNHRRSRRPRITLPSKMICKAPPCLGLAPGPEVALIIGIQGAGKEFLAIDYEDRGYTRAKGNSPGKRLENLKQILARDRKVVVLEGTYPTRRSRAPIIAAAHAQDLPVRCLHLQIPLAEAQRNVVQRMLDQHGRLLEPEEMSAGLGGPSPGTLRRWQAAFEPPTAQEGFYAVDTLPFLRRANLSHFGKGLLLDPAVICKSKSGADQPTHPDDVELLPGRTAMLLPWLAHGYHLFFLANLDGTAAGQIPRPEADAIFQRAAELLKLPVTEIAYCQHLGHPVRCWCRMPLPGLGVYLMDRHKLARRHLVVVGAAEIYAHFAAGLGVRFWYGQHFFRG